MLTKNSNIKWKCTGSEDKPHPQVTNYGDKCTICSLSFDVVNANHQIRRGRNIIFVSFVLALIAGGMTIIASIYVWQKLLEANRTKAELKEIKVELEQAKREIHQVPQLKKQLQDTQKNLKLTRDKLASTDKQLKLSTDKLDKTEAILEQNKEQLEETTKQFNKASDCVELMGQTNHVLLIGVNFPREEVISIQTRLHSLGFYQGEIEGKFGKSTVEAVKQFQQSCEFRR